MPSPPLRALVLAGPTSSGKSAAALHVAQEWGAVILSADAMQVYRGMDVGTGKVSPTERAPVPHFGLDIVDPGEPFDAADFVRVADAVLAEHARVVVAGGTSLYLRALVRGLVTTPPADPALREELEALHDPHSALAAVDPTLAARLHPNDRLRVVRGLEVFRQTGRALSAMHAEHAAAPDRLVVEALWLDRSDLTYRIDARVHEMVALGYVDEVRGLLEAGVDRSCKPMQSLGYRHFADHVLDALPLSEAIRRTQRDTRRFARKQRNWMRQLGWERVEGDHLGAAAGAATRLWGPVRS
ncbi:MAG: tRNA dimethylallyltransferase [Myxococcota bacterium]|jgi:tRNA dimethylallyltransferase